MAQQSQRLDQHQELSQRLNPLQVTFGRILEMSAPEYEDEVRRVVDENPALEVVSDNSADVTAESFGETSEQMQRADYASDEDMPDYSLPRTRHTGNDSRDAIFANDADDTASAASRLEQQLDMLDITPLDRAVATYVIGNLDSNGYLTRDASAIADDIAIGAGLDVTPKMVEEAIAIVRTLDPAGIGAADLRQCLLLQLDRLDIDRPDVQDATTIVRDHFALFSHHNYERLIERAGITRHRFDRANALIRTLNPKPGALLESTGTADRARHISPDFIVEPDEVNPGRVTVSIATQVPDLAVSQSFELDTAADPGAAAFIKARRDEAREFIDSTQRRTATLMAVMEAIVKLQPEFFATFDRSTLRPMTLRDIRNITGLDESIISRATSRKYVATPGGIFSIKSLFGESTLAADASVTARTIEDAIRDIIAAEDPASPARDSDIADVLAARGLPVARRTVAKYRERLGIPIARHRRR